MTPLEVQALGFAGALTLITLYVFGRLLRRIREQGGKVQGHGFALPELLMSLVLAGFFAALIVSQLARPASEPSPKVMVDQVLPNALFFLALTVGVAGFMRFRGLHLRTVFGLDRLSTPRALALALGLLAAAYPLVMCSGLLTQFALRHSAQEQELVTLFKDVARGANGGAIAQIVFAGAVIAPLCEEFLFRGLFYPVFKRHLGAVASAVLTAALFAAFHLNLAALPSLFVLALCFTVAYEATGSLLVPMAMHALFNATTLSVLYFFSTRPVPT